MYGLLELCGIWLSAAATLPTAIGDTAYRVQAPATMTPGARATTITVGY